MNNQLYEEQIEWLFRQFPSYQKVGSSAYKPSLDNTFFILDCLAIPLDSIKFIHVAGTNGKGSTSSLIASVLQQGGYRTGLFTSPHIKDFRERIKINGNLIPKDFVLDFILKVKQKNWEIAPSFFEITWAMALSYFQYSNCEFAVIETGLGGRLDATNVIKPLVSVITSIGLDHTDILGPTRKHIAYEKAGIIKQNTDVVTMSLDVEIKDVIEEVAHLNNANLIEVDTSKESTFWKKNELIAREAIKSLINKQGVTLSKQTIESGILNVAKNTGLRGRLEELQSSPKIIIDGAHNKQGVIELFETMKSISTDFSKLHVLYGASNDKEIDEILSLIPEEVKSYLTSFNHSRAMSKAMFMEKLGFHFEKYIFFDSPKDALAELKITVNKDDTILVFGSFFLLAEIV